MSPGHTDIDLDNRIICDIWQSARLVYFTSAHAVRACNGDVHLALFHRVHGEGLVRRDLYQDTGYVLLYAIETLGGDC